MNLDFDTEERLTGLEVLSASKRYSSSDIFNLSTENLILVVVRGGEPFYPLRFESAGTESLILEILKPSYLFALAEFRCRGAIIAPDSAWVCGRAANEKPMPNQFGAEGITNTLMQSQRTR